jgi:hypothetical protein
MADTKPDTESGNKPEYVPLAEVQRLIDEALSKRDREHSEQLAATLAAANPGNLVPAHGGGPGHNRHQRSWSLAEQEAAARGEELEHWV